LVPQELLRKKGMKVTALRRRVLELFFERREPLSHQEIYELLSASGQEPDRVTLYRVLSAFSDAQIVHEVRGTDGPLRFCLHQAQRDECPGNHPHFLCRGCGRMLCLSDQSLPRVQVPEGALVEGKQLLIFGLCPECAREA
jgi:Fur family ferric uptake transcriptional regulator/Fur family zinc uptake transcriptional regulator